MLVAATALGVAPSAQKPGTGETMPATAELYPWHKDIPTTMFWVGEPADASNGYISNVSSAWDDNWVKVFGGVDDPNKRCGYNPCGFQPLQNPFYGALPVGDYTDKGPKPESQLKMIPWHKKPLEDDDSDLKNYWIEDTFDNGKEVKVVYIQWEDVGPVYDNDWNYVFGTARPKNAQSGLDLSPAAADYLGLDGKGNTTWRFVKESDVPDGPWKEVVTRSKPQWN